MTMAKITAVRLTEFTFPVKNIGLETAAAGVGNMAMVPGNIFDARRFAVRINTDVDVTGEYIANWVSTPSSIAQAGMLAPLLIGQNPEHREKIYDDLKREVRAYDHMGHGVLDIALWDLSGKLNNVSVKTMLGGFRDRLPTYASSYCGQESPGGLCTPEAFADYAEQCKEAGFHGFKIHGWLNGEVKREIANLRGIRKRVGDDWNIMIDPASMLHTWNDALKLGLVCDEVNCLWYEDPYKDSSVSAYGHQRLREKLKTPLLVSEHVRGLEQKASFMLAGGCDMIHADPEYDMGITGTIKIAHFCEALGLDVQLHAVGPAHRLCMSAMRNTMFYEMALIGPDMPNMVGPVYACDYSDQQEDLPADGCVPVPDGPGLGVVYDWGFVDANQTNDVTYS
jgi:L-alanine-DL-glutamate epimerase-like enolase superfamily enzyme